jgi:hypothetical protein
VDDTKNQHVFSHAKLFRKIHEIQGLAKIVTPKVVVPANALVDGHFQPRKQPIVPITSIYVFKMFVYLVSLCPLELAQVASEHWEYWLYAVLSGT